MHPSSYKEIIDYCFAKVTAFYNRPVLFAVTGDSGSGKSYYANLLKQKFDEMGVACTYIDADDFLISRIDREPMKQKFYKSGEFKGKSYWELLENMFRLDEFKGVISDLRTLKPSAYNSYSRATGKVPIEKKTVIPNDFVLFDSSMLIDLMDFVIMVDVDRKNILARKVERDRDLRTPEQIIDMHQKVQGYYWDRCKPKNPDIIINNNDFDRPQLVKG